MDDNVKISEYPLINELRGRIRECTDELLLLLEDWHFLQNEVQPRILFIYETYFGDLESEIDNKSEIASMLDRRVELLSIKMERGEELNPSIVSFVDSVVNKEFEKNKSKFTHRYNNWKMKDDAKFSTNEPDKKDLNFVKYYRSLVKILHPDVTSNSESYEKHWVNVQDAYKKKDHYRLKLFYQTLCQNDKNYLSIDDEQEQLKGEIRELELSINAQRRKLERIKNEEPFCFEDKLNDPAWIERRKRKLKEQLFTIDRQIHHNKKLLNSLTNNFEKPEKIHYSFNDSFMSEAYFKAQ